MALFKEDLAAAALDWADNRAKSKKYSAIGEALAGNLRQYERKVQALQLKPTAKRLRRTWRRRCLLRPERGMKCIFQVNLAQQAHSSYIA